MEARRNIPAACKRMACHEYTPGKHKTRRSLAIAIGQGVSVAAWARENTVPERTARRWSKEPRVRAEVDAYRRSALDQAVGRMARRATWATNGIAKLAKGATSESVRLAALRSILSDMMSVSDFAVLDQRMTKIEEQLNAQSESAASTA
jgi:hypothetical protein